MRRHVCQVLAAAFLLAGLGAPAHGQSAAEVTSRIEELIGNASAFEAAFEALQFAINADDRETVASLVKYPFNTTLDGRRFRIANDAQFLRRYDDLVTAETKSAILAQTYATLFVNSDGVMFGDGQVWMTAVCAGRGCARTVWLITAINR